MHPQTKEKKSDFLKFAFHIGRSSRRPLVINLSQGLQAVKREEHLIDSGQDFVPVIASCSVCQIPDLDHNLP